MIVNIVINFDLKLLFLYSRVYDALISLEKSKADQLVHLVAIGDIQQIKKLASKFT